MCFIFLKLALDHMTKNVYVSWGSNWLIYLSLMECSMLYWINIMDVYTEAHTCYEYTYNKALVK